MFEYLAMAYKDSDYTITIAGRHWHKCTFLVLTLSLVLELRALLSSSRPPLLKHTIWLLLEVQLSWKTHKDSDYTAMNAIVH